MAEDQKRLAQRLANVVNETGDFDEDVSRVDVLDWLASTGLMLTRDEDEVVALAYQEAIRA